MNNVTLIGRLTRDPEVRYTNTQMAVCNFTIAVDRVPDKNGNRQADFPRIVVFGKQAENLERYQKKGRLIAVEGRLQTSSYDKPDGTRVYTTEVVANRIEYLEWGDKSDNYAGGGRPQNSGNNYGGGSNFNGGNYSGGGNNSYGGGNYNGGGNSYGGGNAPNNAQKSTENMAMPDSFQEIDEDIPF